MKELKNWNEITKGLYRFVIGANVCYEIHLLKWAHQTDVLTAQASLFIVGDWNKDGCKGTYFERECLLEQSTVQECLLSAIKDNEENNN